MQIFLFLLNLAACREQTPVLVRIPAEPLLSAPQDSPVPQKKKQARIYQKPAGVVVDVQTFGGGSFNELQPYIAKQLGGFVSKRPLTPKDGERRIYQKGEIRVVDDSVYMIRFELPEAMRRSKALQSAGFFEYVDDYIITHHEYKLLHKYDFVRIRMPRQSKENELVTHLEAWKWVPQDRANR